MNKAELHNMEQFATAASYGASGASVFMGLTVDEWGVIGVLIGIFLGVATFCFNVWFKMKYQR